MFRRAIQKYKMRKDSILGFWSKEMGIMLIVSTNRTDPVLVQINTLIRHC